MMDNEQFLLVKAAEEANEVALEVTKSVSNFGKLALKSAQFGLNEIMPGQPFTNKERMHLELNDLYAAIKMLNESCDFGYDIDLDKVSSKISKVNKFKKYSIDLGRVTVN